MNQDLNESQANLLRFQAQQVINFELDFSKFKKQALQNIIGSMVIMLILGLLLILSDGKNWGSNMHQVVLIAIALRLCLMVPVEVVYIYLVRHRLIKISTVQVARFTILLLLNVWYVYAATIFTKSKDDCQSNVLPLYVASVIIAIEALIVFTTTLLIFMLCIWVFTLYFLFQRQDRNQNLQKMRIKDVLLNAASLKISSDRVNHEDDWAICYDEFNDEHTIIRLPCNPKHYFHAEWIGDWVERNNVCPLCKAEITEDVINQCRSEKYSDCDIEMSMSDNMSRS